MEKSGIFDFSFVGGLETFIHPVAPIAWSPLGSDATAQSKPGDMEDYDAKYDFEAPMYFDFTEGEEQDPGADVWFGTCVRARGHRHAGFVAQTILGPYLSGDSAHRHSCFNSFFLALLADHQRSSDIGHQGETEGQEVMSQKTPAATFEAPCLAMEVDATATPLAAVEAEPKKKIYANLCSAGQGPVAVGQHRLQAAKRKAESQDHNSTTPKRQKSGRAVVGTPEVYRRARAPGSRTKDRKTSEEIELEEIEQLKQKAARQKRLSRESFKRLSQSAEYVPTASTKPLTKPEEFHFQTDVVLRRHRSGSLSHMAAAVATSDPISHNSPSRHGMILRNFTKKTLCEAPAASVAVAPAPTKPKPFRFQSRIRDGASAVCKPFVALAQQVQRFASKTPPRFHKRSAKDDHFEAAVVALAPPAPTIAVTPDLQTAKRPKRATSISTLQQEEALMADIKPFRARPMNQEILHSVGDYGVPRVNKKPPTQPTEAKQFNTEIRAQLRAEKHLELGTVGTAQSTAVFAARGVPKGLFEQVIGVPSKTDIPLTEPKTPSITKPKTRVLPESPTQKPVLFRAAPIPHARQVFHFQPAGKATLPEPFERMSAHPDPREIRTRLVAEQEERERELRNFKANPLPNFDGHPVLPVVAARAPTAPEPFQLRSVALHEERKEKWLCRVEQELEEEIAKANAFHAVECNVTKMQPFVVKPSTRGLTEVSEFALNVETRLSERKRFDQMIKEKELQEMERKRKEEEEARALQEDETKHLRQAAVHKAQPVKNYRPLQVMASDKQLTEPVSPCLGPRKRQQLMRV